MLIAAEIMWIMQIRGNALRGLLISPKCSSIRTCKKKAYLAHNPEVAGSNPAPASQRAVAKRSGPVVFSERRRETSAAFSLSTPVSPRGYDSCRSPPLSLTCLVR